MLSDLHEFYIRHGEEHCLRCCGADFEISIFSQKYSFFKKKTEKSFLKCCIFVKKLKFKNPPHSSVDIGLKSEPADLYKNLISITVQFLSQRETS